MEKKFENLIIALQDSLNPWTASDVVEYTGGLQEFNLADLNLSEKEIEEVSLLYSQTLAGSLQNLVPEVFCSCLDLFVSFHSKYGHFKSIGYSISDFFRMNGYLTITYYNAGELVDNSILYMYYLNGLQAIIKSESFGSWCKLPGHESYIEEQIKDFFYDLMNFCINKRAICFFELTDLILCLRSEIPEQNELFQPLLAIFSRLKNSFIISRHDGIEKLNGILDKYSSDDKFILKLKEMYSISSANKPDKLEELTPETAFKIAFEEVFGDLKISSEEQVILKRLKEFIRISPLHYQNIFAATATKIKQQKKKNFDRDFSREEFLYKAALKAFEDGVLTIQEKRILRGICNALELDNEVAKNVLLTAQKDAVDIRAEKKASGTSCESNDSIIQLTGRAIKSLGTAFGRLMNTIENEERSKGLFDPETEYFRSATFTIVKEIFKDFDKFKERYNPSDSFVTGLELQYEGYENLVVTDFIWDRRVSPVPVIAMFSNSENIHELRTQFKGNNVNCYFTENIPQALVQDPILRLNCSSGFSIYNVCLAKPLQVNSINIFDNMEKFLKGLNACNGNYDIVLVDYQSLSPFLVINGKGFLEPSAIREKAFRFRIDGNYDLAIEVLEKLHIDNPLYHGICRDLGLCYELLGDCNEDDTENYDKAQEFYEKELKINPTSLLALNNLGLLYIKQGDLDVAIEKFKKTCGMSEAFIPGLCNYTEMFIKRAKQSG
ncbi:tetratricopeptide repeat protein, partial [bacterium]|nr:tetratricopeptide repeat protein [bacterium]